MLTLFSQIRRNLSRSAFAALSWMSLGTTALAQEQKDAPAPENKAAITDKAPTPFSELSLPALSKEADPSPWSVNVSAVYGGLPSFKVKLSKSSPALATPSLHEAGLEGRVYYTLNDQVKFFAGVDVMKFWIDKYTYDASATVEKMIAGKTYGLTVPAVQGLPNGFGAFLDQTFTAQLPGNVNGATTAQQLLNKGVTFNGVSATVPQIVTGTLIYFRSDVTAFLDKNKVGGEARTVINSVLNDPAIIFPALDRYLNEAQTAIVKTDKTLQAADLSNMGQTVLKAAAQAAGNETAKAQILALAADQAFAAKFNAELAQLSAQLDTGKLGKQTALPVNQVATEANALNAKIAQILQSANASSVVQMIDNASTEKFVTGIAADATKGVNAGASAAERITALAQSGLQSLEAAKVDSGTLTVKAKDADLRSTLAQYGSFFSNTNCNIGAAFSSAVQGHAYTCSLNPADLKNAIGKAAQIVGQANGDIISADVIGIRYSPFGQGGDSSDLLWTEASAGPMFVKGALTAQYNNVFMETKKASEWFDISGTGLMSYAVPEIADKSLTLPTIKTGVARAQVAYLGAKARLAIGTDWAAVARTMGAGISKNWHFTTSVGAELGLAKAVTTKWEGLPAGMSAPKAPIIPLASGEIRGTITYQFAPGNNTNGPK